MDMIAIGKIRTSHGLRGFVKVVSYSGEVEHFYGLEKVILSAERIESEFAVEEVKPLGDSVIIKFISVDTPEKAKSLAGMEIRVPRAKAAPLEEGEYYHADLLGCEMLFQGETAGRVKSIVEGGGGELFEVELTSGETALIPFRDEFIGEINVEKKLIELKNDWILG